MQLNQIRLIKLMATLAQSMFDHRTKFNIENQRRYTLKMKGLDVYVCVCVFAYQVPDRNKKE